MDEKLKGLALVGLLLYIASMMQVGDLDLEPNYYCEGRELKAFCYDLSSTGKTCYTQEGKIGGKRCTEGWKEIPKAEETPQATSGSSRDHCTSKRCV